MRVARHYVTADIQCFVEVLRIKLKPVPHQKRFGQLADRRELRTLCLAMRVNDYPAKKDSSVEVREVKP